ncbi:hypothetical protein [Maribacter thermophilus]|uniref:hypothetical protein n=1 Tax=Maribacter thermophilus TaxID=1197874 RepID=UPI000B112B2B|nr:hypothetical protein [Maribacter thermophilus]
MRQLFTKRRNPYKSFLIILLLLTTINIVVYKMSEETIEITILDKERVIKGDGDNINSKFLVYSEEEILENRNSLLYLKFNSAEYQDKLNIGQTYTVKVVGWQTPFLSFYRNIVLLKDDYRN